MKGKGENLSDPDLTALSSAFLLTGQLINGETGMCMESTFDAQHVLKADEKKPKGEEVRS